MRYHIRDNILDDFSMDLIMDSVGYYIQFDNKETMGDGGLFSMDHQGFLPHNYLKTFEYINGVDEL